ncbi:ATP-binding protein [Nocardioides sp.]|uniref:ATP-binding protein n=1 Tax=Nocardioides sp. TaxID=35761 RepID=UPI002732560C|nr:ATP-binding protein [Nocardioides sp.]MDP3890486.1 ATP-binding protein [Nocardioides sp.]
MATEPAEYAWNLDFAYERLDPTFRAKKLTAHGELVITPTMRRLAASMPSFLDENVAVAVSGPVGSGKSTLMHALAAVSDVNTAIVDIVGNTPSDKAVWGAISRSVIGHNQGTAEQLRLAVAEHLTVVPTLLLVDEAQFIPRAAMMQLRWLWDQPFERFAIVLAGSGLYEVLERDDDVDTRIDERIPLRHLTPDKMRELIVAHHRWARATHPWVLDQIDAIHCHGSWRAWSKVLRKLARVNHEGPITVPVAERALSSVKGHPVTLPTPPPDLANWHPPT